MLRRLLSGLARLDNVQPKRAAVTGRTSARPWPSQRSHRGMHCPNPSDVAEGWRLERVTAPSRLFGANGLRTGPDGRVYIAQVTGSQISALDHRTGQLETVSAKGGEIVAPDDVAFDASGNLYATEVMDGRVSMLDTAGRTRVLRDDVPSANGITVHRGRLFIGECREGGRLLEFDLRRRAATGAAGERALTERDGGRPGRPAVFPGDGRQRDLARRSRRRRATVCCRRSRCARLGQVRLAGLHRLDPGGQRAGAAHRSSQRRTAAAGPAKSGAGQLHLRRRPGAGIQLHRRDHRDIARRQNANSVARRAELAAGSDRGSRRAALHRRRHVFLRRPARRVVADRGDVVQPRLSRIPARRCVERTRRVRRDDVRWPGQPLPAGGERKRGAGRRFRPALRRRGQPQRCGLCRIGHRTGAVVAVGQHRGAGDRPA